MTSSMNVRTHSPITLLEYTERAFQLAKIAAASRCFGLADDDDATIATACMKILMGMEYGLSPTISLKAIHMISGTPTLSYQTIGMLIKRSGKYDYKKGEHTDKKCVLEFFEGGVSVGTSEYTIEDASKAGLLEKRNSLWLKIPKSMLFARALTTGANQYCGEIFGGPIYSPGADFGEQTEAEVYGNETAVEVEAAKKDSAASANPTTAGSKATKASAAATAEKPADPKPSEQKSAEVTAAATPATSTAAASATESAVITPPGETQLGEILAAGAPNGWNEENLEVWVLPFLEAKGVDCADMGTIFATWTWDHVTEAINFVVANKPA